MIRYTTRYYTTIVSEDEAYRLARIDGTPLDKITRADVELLHLESDWAYWSDGEVTSRPRTAAPISSLSVDAVRQIRMVRASDSPRPGVPWRTIAEIAEVLSLGPVDRALTVSGDGAHLDEVQAMRYRDVHGSERTLYVAAAGMGDGCIHFVTDDLEKALRKVGLPG